MDNPSMVPAIATFLLAGAGWAYAKYLSYKFDKRVREREQLVKRSSGQFESVSTTLTGDRTVVLAEGVRGHVAVRPASDDR